MLCWRRVLTLLLASSAHAQTESYEVETDTISHETTQDIRVWFPASGSGFPIVWALHGYDRSNADWGVIGPVLAAHGVVVFAPDYRSTEIDQGRWDHITQDLGCASGYEREVAGDYGGDLTLPVIGVGHSLGAPMAIGGAFETPVHVPGESDACFSGPPAPLPDAVVALAGCYYEWRGQPTGLDPAQFGSGDAKLVLVGAEDDVDCAPSQSKDATEAFVTAGHDATYVEIPGANHMTLIGHDFVDGEEVLVPDHPAVAAVVQVILDVIDAERGFDGSE